MEKSALITGAGGGLGRGLALALARRGYQLSLTGRDESRLQAVAAEIGDSSTVRIFRADLACPAERSRLIQNLQAESNAPSLLIHNAARMPTGEFLEQPAADLETTLAVNLLAPLEITHHLSANLTPKPDLLFILSSAARFPQPYNSLYSASKTGLRCLAEALQVEMTGQTRICLAYPPLTETPMTARFTSPLPKADPLRVAEKIIRAYEAGMDEVTWLDWEIFPALFHRLFPRLFRQLLKNQRTRLKKAFSPS